MIKLNPIQEALIPHISKAEYVVLCEEAEELMIENVELRERVEHLEREITTHAYGGWRLH